MGEEVMVVEALGVTLTVKGGDAGLDVSLALPEGQHNAWCESHDGGCEIVTREIAMPSIGASVMVDGKHVTVAQRWFDEGGHLFVRDADTGLSHRWA